MIYHEIRGSLGLLATAAQSAADDATDQSVKYRCEAIVRTAERILQTALHVLDGARPSEEQPEPELFDPIEAASAAISDLGTLGMRVSLQVPPVTAEMWGARAHLDALITSLLNNAADHSEPGTAIDVTVYAEDESVLIEIANTCASTRRHRGLGLGMYICAHLARELRADLQCQRHGDLFVSRIRLPLLPIAALRAS
jgi:signal transduction histidine kinase